MYYNKLVRNIFFIFLIFLVIFSYFSVFADDIETQDESIDIGTEIQSNTTTEVFSQEENLNINSRSCIVIDRLSKQVLYGKNEKNRVKMASTTKIMTAVIVLENSSLNKTVEVSKKAASTGGSRLGLKTGDKITIRDLLYGLLLCSGNDDAVT